MSSRKKHTLTSSVLASSVNAKASIQAWRSQEVGNIWGHLGWMGMDLPGRNLWWFRNQNQTWWWVVGLYKPKIVRNPIEPLVQTHWVGRMMSNLSGSRDGWWDFMTWGDLRLDVVQTKSAWWLTYPSEKWWSSSDWRKSSQLLGKMTSSHVPVSTKQKFQANNFSLAGYSRLPSGNRLHNYGKSPCY